MIIVSIQHWSKSHHMSQHSQASYKMTGVVV